MYFFSRGFPFLDVARSYFPSTISLLWTCEFWFCILMVKGISVIFLGS